MKNDGGRRFFFSVGDIDVGLWIGVRLLTDALAKKLVLLRRFPLLLLLLLWGPPCNGSFEGGIVVQRSSALKLSEGLLSVRVRVLSWALVLQLPQ